MDKFFKVPFASAGDVAPIPDAVDGAGNVSFTQGYGPDYQRQKTDPLSKNIERDKANWLYGAMTEELGLLQRHGAPDFITTALNGGTPHEYDIGDYVRYDDGGGVRVYVSRVAANVDLPSVAASWRLVRDGIPTATAGGTANALTADFSPDFLTPVNGEPFILEFTNANTGAATIEIDGGAPVAIVKGNDLPLQGGDILGANAWGLFVYDTSLSKCVLLTPATGFVPEAAVQGARSNLKARADGVAASIAITCDELILGTGTGAYVVERNIAGAINTATLGVNGLDTGALTANTWFSFWRIGKADGTRAYLFSLSATAPTMPADYIYKARMGWFKTDSTGSMFPLSFIQYDNIVRWKPAAGSNLTSFSTMASGGSVGSPGVTLVAIATAAFVPPTAVEITVNSTVPGGSLTQLSSSTVANGGYQGSTDAPTSPGSAYRQVTLPLESTNIYWATGSISITVYAAGWRDNL